MLHTNTLIHNIWFTLKTKRPVRITWSFEFTRASFSNRMTVTDRESSAISWYLVERRLRYARSKSCSIAWRDWDFFYQEGVYRDVKEFYWRNDCVSKNRMCRRWQRHLVRGKQVYFKYNLHQPINAYGDFSSRYMFEPYGCF